MLNKKVVTENYSHTEGESLWVFRNHIFKRFKLTLLDCHATLAMTSELLNKKSAMFGLDARIALAIFGALSVITGATLYKAVQQAKTTAILTEMQEIGKAWESYYLDTGVNLPTMSNDLNTIQGYMHKLPQLMKNTDNISGWKGPYISYPVLSEYRLDHPSYHGYFLHTIKNSNDWGGDVDMPETENWCPSGQSCSIWLGLDGLRDKNVPLVLDKKIDNGDGAKDGNFRWHDKGSSPWYIRIYLKIAPIKNPND